MPRLSIHLLVLAISAVGLLFTQSPGFSSDPGTGWHILSGSLMGDSLSILRADPFLANPLGAPSRPWICDQWLSDIVIAACYKTSGFSGATFMVAALFVATFFSGLYSILRRSGCRPISATLSCLIAFKLAQVHFLLRPVVFSFPLFLMAWSISRDIARQGKITPGVIGSSCLIFFLWANVHPSFFLGFIWLGLGTVVATLSNRTALLPGLTLVLLSLAITFANPFGIELHLSILELAKSDYFMKMHQEWLPPRLNTSEGDFFFGIFALLVGGFICSFLVKRRPSLFDLLSFVIAAFLSLRSIRTIPIFGIATAPLLASSIECFGALFIAMFSNTHRLEVAFKGIELKDTLRNPTRPSLYCSVVLVLCAALPINLELFGIDPSPKGAGFPVPQLAALKKNAESRGVRYVVFAWPGMGGAISFYGYPFLFPVIDDRNTLIGEQFYREYFAARSSEVGFQGFILQLGVTHILLEDTDELVPRMSEWAGVRELPSGDGYRLFEIAHHTSNYIESQKD